MVQDTLDFGSYSDYYSDEYNQRKLNEELKNKITALDIIDVETKIDNNDTCITSLNQPNTIKTMFSTIITKLGFK